ncbi:MAG: D-alanine--D-alanine ligase [Armatimonadetes bacterium]|nr:D-alanine--D-alanine ligase [Armatimonadota bacterium]
MGRLRVAVVYGGQSGEHEVSILSARSILDALDRARFDPLPVYITREGRWTVDGREVILPTSPAAGGLLVWGTWETIPVDVFFPALHGTYGEDGTIQGAFEMAGIPYAGADVLASAIGMDKDITKRLLHQAGLPVVPFLTVTGHQVRAALRDAVAEVDRRLAYPVFVKPAALGSSVGVTKVRASWQMPAALETALEYDTKAIVEQGVDAREIECSVLGNHDPWVSVPGEVVPAREFYDYTAKYLDEQTRLLVPAPIGDQVREEIRDVARRAYMALGCSGMARVDCFLERQTDRILVNEVNTIPGFTAVSMYPRMWEASGLSYSALLSRLIDLATERWAERRRLKSTYEEGARLVSPAG